MERWRIHRLKINGFKVFSEFEESYSSDLIVYDGPNGFGKTSLFDAKQLLFCNKLPRVSARVDALKVGNKSFNKSLYQNHNYQEDISIIAELTNGSSSIFVMRLAKNLDLSRSKNKPNIFNEFKLYELTSFDKYSDPKLIVNENKFWAEKLGEKFLQNFSVLNYLQQDSKSIVIPDACDDRKRTDQISHLLNLDALEKRIDNISQIKSASKEILNVTKNEYEVLQSALNELFQMLTASDSTQISYTKLTDLSITPQWDLENPFSIEDYKNIDQVLDQVSLLKKTYIGRNEIAKRIRNKQKIDFIKRTEFDLAVRLFHHFSRLPELNENKKKLDDLNRLCKILNIEPAKLALPNVEIISDYIDFEEKSYLSDLAQDKNNLLIDRNDINKKQTEVIQLREKLIKNCSGDEHDCPLCGFDYQESTLLTAAIETKTVQLKQQLDGVGLKLTQCLRDIDAILSPLKNHYKQVLETLRNEYEGQLHTELISCEHQRDRLKSIGQKLIAQGIELPKIYTTEIEGQAEQISHVKQVILQSLESEDEIVSDKEFDFFVSQFGNMSKLEQLTLESIDLKKNYIQQQHNLALNTSILQRKKDLKFCVDKLGHLEELDKQLEKIHTQLKHAQTDYTNRTIGQMESLFHIYSGRLLQNYQSGLGVFIDTPNAKRKTSSMNFTTVRDSQHDATLSMSSGQISALSLSLFLALNKKYAKTAFVFIDDPTQCMDEINIASLSDLLRVELRDRQVIISTHEQDISDYLCYRYGKAGLSRKQINLLEKAKRVEFG